MCRVLFCFGDLQQVSCDVSDKILEISNLDLKLLESFLFVVRHVSAMLSLTSSGNTCWELLPTDAHCKVQPLSEST